MATQNPSENSSEPFPERSGPTSRSLNTLRRLGRVLTYKLLIEPQIDHNKEFAFSLDQLVQNENDYLDLRQKGHKNNVFRDKKLAENTPDRLAKLNEFMDELSTKTSMTSRYELFMDERYADDVYTLDLDETKEPGSHDAVEALKVEYRQLRAKLMDEGVIEGELTRGQATRTFHFSNSLSPDHYLGTRNRILFSFDRDDSRITVAKRMTFLLDKTAVPDDITAERNNGTRHIALIQKKIDRQEADITPVRTVYYVKKKPLAR